MVHFISQLYLTLLLQVRKAILASSPNIDRDNIVPSPKWEQGSSADATIQMMNNDVAKAVHNNVKLDAVWRLGQVCFVLHLCVFINA